jgi:beta-lactamase regulating signal transducer with metallopeptidase domain
MTNIALFILKLTLLLAGGAGLAVALRSRSAATRHLVWALTLAGALLFAVAARFAPPVRVAIPDWRPVAAVAPAITVGSVQTPSLPTAAPSSIRSMPGLLAIVWLGGVALVVLWLAAGHLALASLSRSATPANDGWRALIDDARRVIGTAREVRILITPRAGAPLTAGTLRPIILLPADAADWPEERRRAALLHEIAHVARQDSLFQLIANLAVALYWFHPLAWIARRRLRRESEMATDDRVTLHGMAASDYARQLLDVAHTAKAHGFTRLVAAGMACPSHLERRLRALLDETRLRGPVSRRAGILTATVLVFSIVPLAAARPDSETVNVSGAEGKAWSRRDAYILHSGKTDVVRTSSTIDEVVAARRRLGAGDYLWVRIGGNEYLIRDESVLEQAEELWAPIEAMKPEQREIAEEERRLDKRIDAIEDHDTTASSEELEQLRARDRAVSKRERELDEREEAMERVVEVKLRRLVDDAIRGGHASKLR